MEVVLSQHIDSTPEVRSGKPRIAGTRITVADIAIMYLRMGQSLELIAGKYDLAPAAVYAAMGYYYDHRDEIDRSIQDDEAFVDTFMKNNPSRLQERLKGLRSE
jgi:uncharacterized protein (DUF433 family)